MLVALEHYCFLNIVLPDNDDSFSTRGPGSSRSVELHYLAVTRQVNHLLMPLLVLSNVFAKCYADQLLHKKIKPYFPEIIHSYGGQWNHGMC